MGGALLHGWRTHAASLGLSRLTVVDPVAVADYADLRDVPASIRPDIIILAMKPQQFNQTLPACRHLLLPGTLVISIAAGISVTAIADLLHHHGAVVRAMPNTPALVGYGATAYYANQHVTAAQAAVTAALYDCVGKSFRLNSEEQLDAVTALSGSGPAYVFLLMEAMQAAGEELGLSADLAAALTRQTLLGAAQLAAMDSTAPAALRHNVTSPNGTTAAALDILQHNHAFNVLINKAMQAAAQRSVALAVTSEAL